MTEARNGCTCACHKPGVVMMHVKPCCPSAEAPKVEQELLERFETAAKNYGWSSGQGTGDDVATDHMELEAAREALLAHVSAEPERTAKAVAEAVEPYRSAIAAVIPSAPGLANQPDSHVLPFYITLGELRGLRVLATIRNEGPKL